MTKKRAHQAAARTAPAALKTQLTPTDRDRLRAVHQEFQNADNGLRRAKIEWARSLQAQREVLQDIRKRYQITTDRSVDVDTGMISVDPKPESPIGNTERIRQSGPGASH